MIYMVRLIKEANNNDMVNALYEFLENYLESEFEGNIARMAEVKVNGYNADWCADQETDQYKKAKDNFIKATVAELMQNFNIDK